MITSTMGARPEDAGLASGLVNTTYQVGSAIGLAAMVRIWQVFPFSFEQGGFPWETVFRWFLAIGIVGSAIGIVVALVSLVRGTHR